MSEYENEQANGTESTAAGVADDTATESTGPTVIKASNPGAEELVGIIGTIKANYNYDVDVRPTDFNFKKSTDKDSGIDTVRETVQIAVPYPSVQGICAILEAGGKGLELLVEAVESITNAAVRAKLSDDYTLNASNFPVDEVSWEKIANTPKATRRGGGIPKEIWDAFELDYIEVMPGATDKGVEQVTRAAKLLKGKLTAVRTNEPVLNLLVAQLAVYADASPSANDYADCIEFLLSKADTFLNVTDEQLLDNL